MINQLEPYEIKYPWFRDIFEWLTLLFFGIAPLCYGMLYWNKVNYELPKLAVIMGIMMIYASLYSFFKYGNVKFIIRIDKQGIHHGDINLIEWKNIAAISLNSMHTHYVRSFYLTVLLKNHSNGQIINLHIGISREKAKMAEIVANLFLYYLSQLVL